MQKGCILLLIVDILLGIGLCMKMSVPTQEPIVPVFHAYAETKPKVALTYDDGPHPVYTEEILDILKERDAKASFFVIGKNVEANEKLLQRMQKEGHLICNHTYDHVDLSLLSSADACMQLCKTSDAIEKCTGVRPMFFRPPFGEWEKILGECTDMLPVMWSVDTQDWLTQDTMNSYHKVVDNVKENDIILMHDFLQRQLRQQNISWIICWRKGMTL